MPIDTPNAAHSEMSESWELTDALRSTREMRRAGTKFLPIEPRESLRSYDVRLERSFLRPAYWSTIRRLVSKAYRKAITIQRSEDLPDALQALEGDIDGAECGLTQFGKDSLEVGVNRGLVHAFVDISFLGSEGATSADRFNPSRVRPRVVRIDPDSLLGWRFETRKEDGKSVLSEIRYKYSRDEQDADDKYGQVDVEYVRRVSINPDTGEGEWEIYRKAKNEEAFLLAESGPFRFSGRRIPLATLYIAKDGDMKARVPLWQLAELNQQDWQVGSDQSNNLRFITFPRQFMAGFDDEDIAKIQAVGPAQAIISKNENAKFELVEHSGASAQVSLDAREMLRREMETEGLAPLTQKTGDITATGQVLNEQSRMSDLERWVIAQQIWIQEIYELAAEWIGEELPEGFGVDIAEDMSLSIDGLSPQELRAMWADHAISHERYLEELKRRGHFSETFDVELEIEKAKEESALAAKAFFSDGEQEDDSDIDRTPGSEFAGSLSGN